MNKKYIQPAIKLKEISAEASLLAGSEKLPLVPGEEVTNPDDILSKENRMTDYSTQSVWDE